MARIDVILVTEIAIELVDVSRRLGRNCSDVAGLSQSLRQARESE